MFTIKNQNIYHIRGDTAKLTIVLQDEQGEEVTDYTAVFSVKKTLKDTGYLFQVPVENGEVYISHDMTQGLPYGDYVYDIEVTTSGGEVETIGPAKYHLLADVTTGIS